MTTENQTYIPVGWKSHKLGAICKVQKGVQFNKIELAEYGLYPCINGGIDPSGYSDLWNTNEDTITISEGGNSCGYVNIQRTKFWCGGHCYTLLNVQDGLEYEFLFWALKGKQDLIMDLRVGSGLPNIQQKAIKEFSFISPTSPTEQQKIASILTKLDEAITQTEQLIGKYKKIKEGLMHDLLTRGIDEQGNIRSEETHKFKDSPMGRIPVEWEVEKLGTIINEGNGTIQTGPFGSQLHANEYIEEGVPVIMPQNILQEGIDRGTLSFISKTKASILKRHITNANDIVFARRGDLSKCAVIETDFIGSICGTGCLLIRVNKANINPFWLRMLYQQFNCQKEINISSVGSTMQNLNTEILSNLVIPKISRIEQNLIVEKIQGIDTLIENSIHNHIKISKKKSGLMHDLLTGIIRVQI